MDYYYHIALVTVYVCCTDSDWDTLLDFVEQSVKICRDVLVSSSRNTAVTVPNYTHGTIIAAKNYYFCETCT